MSLKIVLLFSLTVIALCVTLGNARVMTKDEVNCIGGKCPDGMKYCNCLSSVEPIMDTYETNASLDDASEMMKDEVNCIGGKCPDGTKYCNCLSSVESKMDTYETNASLDDVTEMTKDEVNCVGGKCPDGSKNCNCLLPVEPIMNTYEYCRKDNECFEYCPRGCLKFKCVSGICSCQC